MWGDHYETNVGLCLLADGTFELVWRQWQLPDNSPIATIETVSMSGSVVTEGGGDEMKVIRCGADCRLVARRECSRQRGVGAPACSQVFPPRTQAAGDGHPGREAGAPVRPRGQTAGEADVP